MSISAIGSSATQANTSATQANAQKTLEQRAVDGDQVAKMELKEEDPGQTQNAAPASEPGKGENVDKYI